MGVLEGWGGYHRRTHNPHKAWASRISVKVLLVVEGQMKDKPTKQNRERRREEDKTRRVEEAVKKKARAMRVSI